jgi:23S rRNA (adenine2503-C2)-methyltransferase
MKIIASSGREDVAIVYIAEMEDGKLVECVEALQPPTPRSQKWVLLVSTMFGCPVGCQMCDAGGYYEGKPTAEQIFEQIDFLVRKRFPDGRVPVRQFKIQFARMGEPALNPAVLNVLREMPSRYDAPGFIPSISTVAPAGIERFMEQLLQIKREQYSGGMFQFQFSIHTTDLSLRDKVIPVKKWSFEQMAEYGRGFYAPGDRKITLNFALAEGMPVDPEVLLNTFDPQIFLIKITPLNPTYRAVENNLTSYIDPLQRDAQYELVNNLQQGGYDVLLSIGEAEENYIGSNCGQYIRRHLSASHHINDGYTYQVEQHG